MSSWSADTWTTVPVCSRAAHGVLEAPLSDGAHAGRDGHGPFEHARAEAVRPDGLKAFRERKAPCAATRVVAPDHAHGVGNHERRGRIRKRAHAHAHERASLHRTRQHQHVLRCGRVRCGRSLLPRRGGLRNRALPAQGGRAHGCRRREPLRHRCRRRRPGYQHRPCIVEVIPASVEFPPRAAPQATRRAPQARGAPALRAGRATRRRPTPSHPRA